MGAHDRWKQLQYRNVERTIEAANPIVNYPATISAACILPGAGSQTAIYLCDGRAQLSG
jgi:hypothetical protein